MKPRPPIFHNAPFGEMVLLARRDYSSRQLDVLADGIVVGRIFRAAASPEGSPWMWTLALWAP
jgi:hypothetical protein